MDEREFFDERAETRVHSLTCPHCGVAGEYQLHWLVRRKRRECPRGGDERDRARFEKARSYMLRRDDQVGCANVRCRKRFEVTGLQSVADLVDTSGLPADHKEKQAPKAVDDRAARLKAAFGRRDNRG